MLLLDPQVLDKNTSQRGQIQTEQHPSVSNELLELLDPKDRLLAELFIRKDLSRRQIAMMLRMNPGHVSRRLRRLIDRLTHPLVKVLSEPDCGLSERNRQVGIDHFLHGLSICNLARKHRLNRTQTRSLIQYIRGWGLGQLDRR